MVKNLRQGAQEDATDFMIRVGTSVTNLDKDWQGQLSQAELESLQYEVSLNGVRQEIRHVLDSEIARRGPLTPHQMYEVVKKYETYVARNKRLEGQSSSPSTGQQKTAGQTSNYKPRFHNTTASPRRWKSLKPRLTNAKRPSRPKRVTLLSLSHLWMMMMGCTYPVI